MSRSKSVNNGWGNNPKVIIICTSFCKDLAVIPECLSDKIYTLKLEFTKSLGERYPYPEYGSASLNSGFLGGEFIRYINEHYLKENEAQALYVKCGKKLQGNSFEKLPFEHIYL